MRTLSRAAKAALLIVLFSLAACMPFPQAAVGSTPTATRSASSAAVGVSRTPYMGWNSYYGHVSLNETTILSVASTLVSSGLRDAGYRIVWLDFGWGSGARDERGELIINGSQWPHGLPWLTKTLHSEGLLAGIYTDMGASGCNGQGVGSLGHYQQDASSFAAWGFDAVKADACGLGQAHLDPVAAYQTFAQALANNSSHRALLLNVCNFWRPGQVGGGYPRVDRSAYDNYQWAPQIAASWRTDTDIGFPRNVQWKNVLRNLTSDAAHPQAAGPGHWNDPDYLAPELGMTAGEAQAQMTMWSIIAAPLIIGSDVRALSGTSIAMLSNPEVIAVDQDPAAIQGTELASTGRGQIWVRRLSDGSRAVALLNPTVGPLTITASATTIGLPASTAYTVRDLWSRTTTRTTGTIAGTVPSNSALLYRVSA